MVFLEISQIWQENTCARFSFLTKLQAFITPEKQEDPYIHEIKKELEKNTPFPRKHQVNFQVTFPVQFQCNCMVELRSSRPDVLYKKDVIGLQLYYKKDSGARVFLWILWNFQEKHFSWNNSGDCFWEL